MLLEKVNYDDIQFTFFFDIENFSSATGGKGCLLKKFFYAFL